MTRRRAVADGGRDRDGADTGDSDRERGPAAPARTPGIGANPRRCGCAGKTPLDRVVFPARERIATALADTSVRLGPATDAAVVPSGRDGTVSDIERHTDVVALGKSTPAVPFTADDGDGTVDRDARPIVTLACAFVGDDLADPDGLGDALATAYAALDGPEVTIGKGHAVQLPGHRGGLLWLEHLRSANDDGDGPADGTDSTIDGSDGDSRGDSRSGGSDPGAAGTGTGLVRSVAANVDAVHAFPDLLPPEQARIAALNAWNDAYARGATAERTVRPVVAAPAGVDPPAARATAWYRAGVPREAEVVPASVIAHGGEGWVLGASVIARGSVNPTAPPLPDDCCALVTRPLGGLAAFALGSLDGDRGLRELGRDRLARDALPVAEALAACRPSPGEAFDPARHLARVTDVSGEGVGGVGRLVASEGRSLRLDRLPVLPAVADAVAGWWTLPDVTVETNGPFAAIGTPEALARVTDRLRGVEGADPVRLGPVDRGDAPIRDATDGDTSRLVEAAARWPAAGERR
ncbi:hypothetical protein SAMN05443636_1656 [Halobaculum gomorrense]|uniref:Selenophosphate synthase n=1 Tax=Halobaculum gomorrense TaxID=43928 RepID=A0A1M5PN39_9EURY|nr:hypothetical protein SAMN05443636_1656 [Halobaculum gomorrense]